VDRLLERKKRKKESTMKSILFAVFMLTAGEVEEKEFAVNEETKPLTEERVSEGNSSIEVAQESDTEPVDTAAWIAE
jgi:hypothetical protein